jgi:ABC-type spermidine/putrescine transport system permease subunit II
MTVDTDLDLETDDLPRARLYLGAGAVCALLSILFMFQNVFLVPVFGLIGIFCAWRGWKNGGNGLLAFLVFAVCGLPALIAGIWLLLLLPNLPSLRLGGVSYQRNG